MSRPGLKDEAFQLPADIIHNIQSFLNPLAAAETSLVSKSWYIASSKPALTFTEPRCCRINFWDFMIKKVHRYRSLNIKLDTLVLQMHSDDENECDHSYYYENHYDNDDNEFIHIIDDDYDVIKDEYYFASLVDKLIDDALNSRVNILDLRFDGVLRYSYGIRAHVFSHKHLKSLCLARCNVNRLLSGKILCSNLVSLTLIDVSVDDITFKNILAGCPKIECLTLCEGVRALKRINANELPNIKSLIVELTLKSTGICGCFLDLRRLRLCHVIVDELFFTNLSTSFPKLEDLELKDLSLAYDTHIRISSHSIRRLSLEHPMLTNMAYFDVPYIKKFKFSGSQVPSLSFTTSSKEWKSELTFFNGGGILDLSKLRDLLIKLNRSEITLCLYVNGDRIVAPETNTENLRLPAVETLKYYVLNISKAYNFLVECLFSYRPKFVSFTYCSNAEAILHLYKKMIENINRKSFSNSTQDSLFITALSVEILDYSEYEWHPIEDLSHIMAVLLSDEPERFRFERKWGSFLPEYTIIEFVTPDSSDFWRTPQADLIPLVRKDKQWH